MARTQAPDFEQRRDRIVAEAAELFARDGFRGSSINDLAIACGVSKSLLYHYFPSKEDILHAVMVGHLDQLLEDAEAAVSGEGDAAARLRRLLQDFMDHYVGASSRQKVLLNELQGLLSQIHPGLAEDARRARVATMLLFGMINWTLTWFDPEGALSPSEVTEMVLDRILAPFPVQAS